MKVDETAFSNLIVKMVAETMPEEQAAYDASSSFLLPAVFSGVDISIQDKDSRGEFQFVEEAKSILQLVGLISATYKIVQNAIKTLSAASAPCPSPFMLAQEWKNQLIAMGIAQEQADLIVSRYLSDIRSAIEASL